MFLTIKIGGTCPLVLSIDNAFRLARTSVTHRFYIYNIHTIVPALYLSVIQMHVPVSVIQMHVPVIL